VRSDPVRQRRRRARARAARVAPCASAAVRARARRRARRGTGRAASVRTPAQLLRLSRVKTRTCGGAARGAHPDRGARRGARRARRGERRAPAGRRARVCVVAGSCVGPGATGAAA